MLTIKNDRQYSLLKTEVERLSAYADDLRKNPEGYPASFVELSVSAVQSKIDEAQQQLLEYERVRECGDGLIESDGPMGLADLLLRARIRSRMTQGDFADKLEKKEQQIQKYEAQSYETASLRTMHEFSQKLGLGVIVYGFLSSEVTSAEITAQLVRLGCRPEFLHEYLLPVARKRCLAQAPALTDERAADCILSQKIVAIASDVFGWSPSAILCPVRCAEIETAKTNEIADRLLYSYINAAALASASDGFPGYRKLAIANGDDLDHDAVEVIDRAWQDAKIIIPLFEEKLPLDIYKSVHGKLTAYTINFAVVSDSTLRAFILRDLQPPDRLYEQLAVRSRLRSVSRHVFTLRTDAAKMAPHTADLIEALVA